MAPASAIPVALEPSRPVGKMMHLVQEQSGSPPLRTCLRLRPTAVPEPRKSCVRLVASSVHGLIAKLCGYFQKQGGLSHLPRPGQKLDASGRVFTETVKQDVAAAIIGVLDLSHSLIIIRPSPTTCQCVTGKVAESPHTAGRRRKVEGRSSADTTCTGNPKSPSKFLG